MGRSLTAMQKKVLKQVVRGAHRSSADAQPLIRLLSENQQGLHGNGEQPQSKP